MWDYMLSIPMMMIFASAAGPILGLASQVSRCRRCGLDLDGSYEKSLAAGTDVPDVVRDPTLVLGCESVEAGTMLRGHVILSASRPAKGVEIRVCSSIAPVGGGPRREIVGPRAMVDRDGRFEILAPTHPVSGVGDLVTVTHRVEASVRYGRGSNASASAPLEVQPRTVHVLPRQRPDVGYRVAAPCGVESRGLFDGLVPGDVPERLAERQLGARLSALWADGMHVVPFASRKGRFAALASTIILASGFALGALLPIPVSASAIIVGAAAILALMAWQHFRPRRDRADEPFERFRVRLRVSGAVALADAVHVRVEVPEDQRRGRYRAELVKREHAVARDLGAAPRDTIRRIPSPLIERSEGHLEAWLELPGDEMPTLVDEERHSVRWSVQVRRGEELVAEHPVCVLPARLQTR
jgi:hypothetical protein